MHKIFRKQYRLDINLLCDGRDLIRSGSWGGNKWLFYKSETDGDPIKDYEGTNRYSTEEKQEILQQALKTQNELESRGISFIFLIAPNKENVYSEYMSDTYKHADISSTDILIGYLQDNGVRIVSPKAELLAEHMKQQLYYSYDTHWNQLGAYIGVKNALAEWSISIPDLAARNITASALKENYHYCASDDLADMLGLRSLVFNDEIEYVVDGTYLIDWTEFEVQQENKEVSHYHNPDAKVNSSVFLVGDSFRVSMLPALGEVFSDIFVVHRHYYAPDMIDQIDPEYVIIEYVERYSSEIGHVG